MDDALTSRRRRALFRSRRRGTKESDLVIGGFAERYVPAMDIAQLDRFEALLERNDPEVLAWIVGQETPPEEFEHDVLDLLRDFKKSL